jgi:UDP-GlcNAc:undecaprenyl-phosphate GlcNAc-1-phosphate transferase
MSLVVLLLGPLVVSAAISAALTPIARRLALVVGAIDRPGPRKVHRESVARLGGLAIVASGCATFALMRWLPLGFANTLPPGVGAGMGVGLLPILAVSIWDDIRPLRSLPKFVAQGFGAAIAVGFGVTLAPTIHIFGLSVEIGLLAAPLSVVWLVGVTNAFNIVDGLDGLAAGLALISAGSLAAIFIAVHQIPIAAATLAVMGAVLGFLPYNFYPAKIFLGDSGATAIGFVLACFALKGGSTLSAGFAVLLPVFVMGLPVAETLVSMARRLISRVETKASSGVFEADRNHFHHRLLALGINHRKVVWILYGAGAGVAGLGLLSILMTVVEAGFLLIALLVAGVVGVSRLGYQEFALIRNGRILHAYDSPVLQKSLFSVFADLVMVGVSVYGALVLRFEDVSVSLYHRDAVLMFAALAPLTATCFWAFGLYRGTWRLAGVDDFDRLWMAVLASTVVAFVLYPIIGRHSGSLSVFVIYALIEVVLASGSRASYRVLMSKRSRASSGGIPVLIYGAGLGGCATVRELLSNAALNMRPVGFLDDNVSRLGRLVNGYPIVGGVEAIETFIVKNAVEAVIVSSEKIGPAELGAAHETCNRHGIRLLRMRVTFGTCEVTETESPETVSVPGG